MRIDAAARRAEDGIAFIIRANSIVIEDGEER
jgi:hypothetical protein